MLDELEIEVGSESLSYLYISEALRKQYMKPEDSHAWTLYLKCLSPIHEVHVIQCVVFQLHPTFPNPTRVLMKPPYAIHETGWGEFDVLIHIYLRGDVDHPITVNHRIQLIPSEGMVVEEGVPLLSRYTTRVSVKSVKDKVEWVRKEADEREVPELEHMKGVLLDHLKDLASMD